MADLETTCDKLSSDFSQWQVKSKSLPMWTAQTCKLVLSDDSRQTQPFGIVWSSGEGKARATEMNTSIHYNSVARANISKRDKKSLARVAGESRPSRGVFNWILESGASRWRVWRESLGLFTWQTFRQFGLNDSGAIFKRLKLLTSWLQVCHVNSTLALASETRFDTTIFLLSGHFDQYSGTQILRSPSLRLPPF